MRFAINLDARRVVTWAGEEVTDFSITRGDSFWARIRFIEGGGYVELPAAAIARIAFKRRGVFSSEILAGQVNWSKEGSGSKAIYSMALNFDTIPINALFSTEPATLDLVMEFEWSYVSDNVFIRQTAAPVDVALVNDYARNTDGMPVEALNMKASQQEAEVGVDDTKWMTPLRTKQAIDAAAASGAVLTLAGIELM